MDIGDPVRTIHAEPLLLPVPIQLPVTNPAVHDEPAPEQPAEPIFPLPEPELVPLGVKRL